MGKLCYTGNAQPNCRVKAMLELPKLMDKTQEYLQPLQEIITGRRGTLQMGADRTRAAAGYKKRLLDFTKSAPKWCSRVVRNCRQDTFGNNPNDKVKIMLLSCITVSARQEIVLLHASSLALANSSRNC